MTCPNCKKQIDPIVHFIGNRETGENEYVAECPECEGIVGES